MALQEGEIFAADFRVVRPLAEGGMGAVYVVEQLSTGSQRALKVMHGALFNDARLRERFAQEARIGARIESEHVVQVVAAGVDAPTGMPWLAMELLRGETLAQALTRKGALSPGEMREIFSQLFHALSAAHAAGIVHRDLKPENIFLAESRRQGVAFTTKILDFGIAKLVAEVTTRATAAVGTPLWMAPEQTESNAQIRPAADVWAVGLIAFYALTGCFYWRAANREESSTYMLLREILTDPIVPASERAAEYGRADLLPSGFDAWFARCLSRSIDERFVDASECRRALDALLGSTENQASNAIARSMATAPTGIASSTPAALAMAATALPAASPIVATTSPRAAVAPPAHTTSPSVSATPMPPIPPPPTLPKGPGIDAPAKGRALLFGALAGMAIASVVGIAIVVGRGHEERFDRASKHPSPASSESSGASAGDDDDEAPKKRAKVGDDDEEKSPTKKATSSAPAGSGATSDPDATKPAATAPTTFAPTPRSAPTTAPLTPSTTAPAMASTTTPASTTSSLDALKASTAVSGATFNALTARSALDGLGWSRCKGSHGTVTLSVTFSPSGRVTSASVVSGTVDSTTSACAVRIAKSGRTSPFTGDPQSVSYVRAF